MHTQVGKTTTKLDHFRRAFLFLNIYMYKHGASCVLDMFDRNTSICMMDIDINVVGFLYLEIEKKRHIRTNCFWNGRSSRAIFCSSHSCCCSFKRLNMFIFMRIFVCLCYCYKMNEGTIAQQLICSSRQLIWLWDYNLHLLVKRIDFFDQTQIRAKIFNASGKNFLRIEIKNLPNT